MRRPRGGPAVHRPVDGPGDRGDDEAGGSRDEVGKDHPQGARSWNVDAMVLPADDTPPERATLDASHA